MLPAPVTTTTRRERSPAIFSIAVTQADVVMDANRLFEALGPLRDDALDLRPRADGSHEYALIFMKLCTRHVGQDTRVRVNGLYPASVRRSRLLVVASGESHLAASARLLAAARCGSAQRMWQLIAGSWRSLPVTGRFPRAMTAAAGATTCWPSTAPARAPRCEQKLVMRPNWETVITPVIGA